MQKGFVMKFLDKLTLLSLFLFLVSCTTESTTEASSKPVGTKRYELRLNKGDNASMECYVYSTDNRVTVTIDLDLSMYNSTMLMQLETTFEDPLTYTADISYTGILVSEVDSACESMTRNFKTDGGTVDCGASKVHGYVNLGDIPNPAKIPEYVESVVEEEKKRCDNYYLSTISNFKSIPGEWGGDALDVLESGGTAATCDAKLENDVAFMELVYVDGSASVRVTQSGDKFYWVESYTGMDSETFDVACSTYKDKPGTSDVLCSGSTISYLQSVEDDESLEDIAVMLKKSICPGLLDGSLTFEDVWLMDR